MAAVPRSTPGPSCRLEIEMPLALDTAQTVFYALGSVAIILGGMLGLRRFAIERPHDIAWEVTLGEGTRRQVTFPEGTGYVHSFLLVLTNRSFAPQRVEGYWFSLFPTDHADFPGRRFDETPRTMDGLRGFFGREMLPVGSTTPPNGVLRFGQTMIDGSPHAAVRVSYAAIGPRPRLILPGFYNDQLVVALGSQIVSIGRDDLSVADREPKS